MLGGAVRGGGHDLGLGRLGCWCLRDGWGFWALWTIPSQTNVKGVLGPNLPTATSPDVTATSDTPFTGLSSGDDVSGLWLKK